MTATSPRPSLASSSNGNSEPGFRIHFLDRVLLPVNRLAAIATGPLPAGMKQKAFWTQIKLDAQSLSFKLSKEQRCGILDFQFSFYSLPLLKYLFREVFIDLDYYFQDLERSPFIIDCGCNIGMSVCFFKALYPQCKILGFEPAADSFAMLSQNVGANEFKDVVLHQCAVGEFDGSINFFQNSQPGSLMASTNVHRVSGRTQTVKQVRLSSFIDRPVDFLKLDVEGAEEGVISDLIREGRIRNIRQMVIEYHHHVEEGRDCFSDFLAALEGAGFGYYLHAKFPPHRTPGRFQDILLYAYRKD
jgi:FkbM family methyltransferase